MLKIQYCSACVDFLTHHNSDHYDVFRTICEFYLIKRYPFEYICQEELEVQGYEDNIHFLENHEYVVSTESSSFHYMVKPLGLKRINQNTYRICMLSRGHA